MRLVSSKKYDQALDNRKNNRTNTKSVYFARLSCLPRVYTSTKFPKPAPIKLASIFQRRGGEGEGATTKVIKRETYAPA